MSGRSGTLVQDTVRVSRPGRGETEPLVANWERRAGERTRGSHVFGGSDADEMHPLPAPEGDGVGVLLAAPFGAGVQRAVVVRVAAAENRTATGFLAATERFFRVNPVLDVDRTERRSADRTGFRIHAEALQKHFSLLQPSLFLIRRLSADV